MKRFIEGQGRSQSTLFPESLEDYITEDTIRVVDIFVEGLDLAKQDFDGVQPKATGRPSCHPAVLLKLYVYGYLNRVQSSRGLERATQRRANGAAQPPDARLQDHRRYQERQRPGDPQRKVRIRLAVPATEPVSEDIVAIDDRSAGYLWLVFPIRRHFTYPRHL